MSQEPLPNPEATLAHYQAQAGMAQLLREKDLEIERWKNLCERLQAQADEMRSGLAITSAAQLAELIDGVRCFHDLGAELIAEAVFEKLPDHIPDTTKMVESQWISVVDRLPVPNTKVLAHSKRCPHFFAIRKNRQRAPWEFLGGNTCHEKITHWMPLPAAPTPTNGDGQHE